MSPGRRDRPHRWWAPSLLSLLGLIAFGASSPASAATTFHLDCSRTGAGDGSAEAPFDSVAAVGAVELGPGDRLLLKRGTTCEGELALRGRGSEGSPAVVGAYGSGEDPEVVGTGRNAVLIDDAAHLIVEDLDVSNPGGSEPPEEATTIRNGVAITATGRTVTNLTVRRLNVHDVAGDLSKSGDGSAGIQVNAAGPPPIRFDRLLIEGNRITRVSRSGISISGTNDPELPAASAPWPNASTGVVVRGNRIDRIAGDGIVPRGTQRAVVEDNVVSRGNLAGRPLTDPRGPLCNAGIWAFRANNTLIQRNEVFGMEHNGCDGTGFDIDYRQDGTIVQHNYSHDNEGGFVLLCTDDADRHGDVRFNLSVNDATTINHGPCAIASGVIGNLSGIRFFNNTVVAPSPSTSIQLNPSDEMFAPGDFQFRNNLIYATEPQTRPMACGADCSHNSFFNLPPSGRAAMTADPRLVDPLRAGDGRLTVGPWFRLRADSPAHGAGIAVEHGGERDYFDDPIDPGRAPSIGFDQAPAAKPPPGNRACVKARTAHRKAARSLRSAKQRLRRLKRKRVVRAKVRRAAGKVRRLTRQKKKRLRAVRSACRT